MTAPDAITRVLANLEAHGLAVEYCGPRVVGSNCPLCPPALGPAGARYVRVPMVVEFGAAGVHFECLNGCDHDDINAVLRQPPQRRAVA
jgi:hypothetical protein